MDFDIDIVIIFPFFYFFKDLSGDIFNNEQRAEEIHPEKQSDILNIVNNKNVLKPKKSKVKKE